MKYTPKKVQNILNLDTELHESVSSFGDKHCKPKIVKNVKVNLKTKTNETICFSALVMPLIYLSISS